MRKLSMCGKTSKGGGGGGGGVERERFCGTPEVMNEAAFAT